MASVPCDGRSYLASPLVAQIRHDADKLNKTAGPALKGDIEINRRELIPNEGTLNVDNLTFPAIYLAIRLDTSAQSIHVHQLRREMEGMSEETDERLLLELDANDQIVIKDASGTRLDIAGVSKNVLARFLNRYVLLARPRSALSNPRYGLKCQLPSLELF